MRLTSRSTADQRLSVFLKPSSAQSSSSPNFLTPARPAHCPARAGLLSGIMSSRIGDAEAMSRFSRSDTPAEGMLASRHTHQLKYSSPSRRTAPCPAFQSLDECLRAPKMVDGVEARALGSEVRERVTFGSGCRSWAGPAHGPPDQLFCCSYTRVHQTPAQPFVPRGRTCMGLLVSTGKFPCGEALVREGLDIGGSWALDDSRGARHWRDYRATNLYSVDPRGSRP